MLRLAALIIVFAAVAQPAFAQATLKVKLLRSEYTGYGGDLCGDDKDCISLGSDYYRYEARVLTVIQGAFSNRRVRFVGYSHAPLDTASRPVVYVKLDTVKDEAMRDRFSVDYWLRDVSFRCRSYAS